MVREPCVAGKFYPGNANELESMIKSFDEFTPTKANVKGIVAPHAGYMYSGKVAASVWGKIEVPDTVIVIGPNHTGAGSAVAVYPEGSWQTPMGKVDVDGNITNSILARSRIARSDEIAHKNEHSIEVQLPFMQFANPKAKLVAIAMGDYSELAILDLTKSICDSADPAKTLVVASSDFSHYEPEYTAKARDKIAIEEIKKLDWRALHTVVTEKEISICGLGPICVAIECANRWGAQAGKLLAYSNSGFMSHDFSNVVTYAALAFK
jgi:MEMO1 family protein